MMRRRHRWTFLMAFFLAVTGVRAALKAQTQPSPNQDQLRVQQQLEAARQAAMEQQRRLEEAERRKRMEELYGVGPPNLAKTAPRRVTEPCLRQVMPGDASVNVATLPLAQWSAEDEAEQIPWKFKIGKPQLRMDQRFEVSYSGTIRSRDLRWGSGAHELVYVTGIEDAQGKPILPPKASRQRFEETPEREFNIEFSDCAFFKPGDYVVWVAVYEPAGGKYNLVKRKVRVPALPPELPLLNVASPQAEFPVIATTDEETPETHPPLVTLPIGNARPINLELVSIQSPASQWANRPDLPRWINSQVLTAASMLVQAQISGGAGAAGVSRGVSVDTLDLVNRLSPFQKTPYGPADWLALATALNATGESSIDINALNARKERSVFLKEWLTRRLEQPQETRRAIVIISGSLLFERGSDLSSLRFAGDCNCRVIHLRFRVANDDVFDHLGDMLKPLRPRTFDVTEPKHLRRALAGIVAELKS